MAVEGPATSLDLLGAQVAVREQISKKRVRYKAKFKCTSIPGSLVFPIKSNARSTIINKNKATKIIKQLVYYQYCDSSHLLTTSTIKIVSVMCKKAEKLIMQQKHAANLKTKASS